MISKIIPIVNLIAIIILFILHFTKKNTENFTGVPSGYTNLLVSDPDGNLDTYSLSTLQTNINTQITNALNNYVTTTTLSNGYQPKGDYVTTNDLNNYVTTNYLNNYVTTTLSNGYQPKGNYVNVDKVYSIFTPTGYGQTGGHDTNIGYLYGSGQGWAAEWNGNGQNPDKNLQWVIREWPPPKTTINPKPNP